MHFCLFLFRSFLLDDSVSFRVNVQSFRFLNRFPAPSLDGVICLRVGGQGRSCNPVAVGKWGFYECRSLFCTLFSSSVVRKLVCLAHWGLLTCGWLHVASREIMLIPTPDSCVPSLLPLVLRYMLCSPYFQPQLPPALPTLLCAFS